MGVTRFRLSPQAMCFQLRDALRVGNIYLSESFFSVKLQEKEAIKTIRDELQRFSIVTEPAKTLFGKVRVSVEPRTFPGKQLLKDRTFLARAAGQKNVHRQTRWSARRSRHLSVRARACPASHARARTRATSATLCPPAGNWQSRDFVASTR